METERELRELKERLNRLETQQRRQSRSSGWLKIIVWVLVILFTWLILVGIFQFISSSSSS